SRSLAPTKLLLTIPVRYRGRSRRAYSISSVLAVPTYSRHRSAMNCASFSSSRPRPSLRASCTSSRVIVPTLPPCQTSRRRALISPAGNPSRVSHRRSTPRSGVISRTPPMSNTTARITTKEPPQRRGHQSPMLGTAPRASSSPGRTQVSLVDEVVDQGRFIGTDGTHSHDLPVSSPCRGRYTFWPSVTVRVPGVNSSKDCSQLSSSVFDLVDGPLQHGRHVVPGRGRRTAVPGSG